MLKQQNSQWFSIISQNTTLSFALMMTGAFSQNVSKLFYELKLVTNNLLFTNIVSTNFSTLVLLQSFLVGQNHKGVHC